MIEQIINDPIMLSVAVAGLSVAGGIIIYKEFIEDKTEKIESEGLEKKFQKIFSDPVSSQGSKIEDWIKIRGSSATPRTLGLAYRAKDMDIQIVSYDRDEKEFKTEKSEGTVYQVLEGSGKFGVLPKKIITKLGIDYFLETYDVPENLIVSGDEYIWFDQKSHFVKFNGIKRHLSREGLQRGWESSFSKIHENYMDAFGDIPEQYSVLSKRISGQLRIENQKSQNFRDFEKLKNQMDKLDAMNS